MGYISKAIIPAAGLGTRMLPITKAVPKEMLPVGLKPMIQYAVEEALRGGIREVCIIINPKKRVIQEYFCENPEEIESLREIYRSLHLIFLDQLEPKGLADAVSLARDFVQDQPFALILPDNIFFSATPAIQQLIPIYQQWQRDVIGLIEISPSEAPNFGNCGRIDYRIVRDKLVEIEKVHDKGPGPFSLGPGLSALRCFPRAIYSPDYFYYIEQCRPHCLGELDDVPVLQRLVKEKGLLGYLLEGKGFDVGNYSGYMAANSYLMQNNMVRKNFL
jgi:UTP--glucose-1-phosphate uridylyltransferase